MKFTSSCVAWEIGVTRDSARASVSGVEDVTIVSASGEREELE